MDFLGELQAVGDGVVAGQVMFRLPQRFRAGGAELGDRCSGTAVVVPAQNAHQIRSGQVIHGIGGQIPLPMFILRQHDFGGGHIAGREGGGQVGDKVVKLLPGPPAGFIRDEGVRFILNGQRIETDAIGGF